MDARPDAEERRLLQDHLASGAGRAARRHAYDADRRGSASAQHSAAHRRRRLRPHRGRGHGARPPRRQRARALQGLRAGGCRRSLECAGLDHLRFDPPAHQARRRLQAAQDRHSVSARPDRPRQLRAQLGFGLLTIGTVACALGVATLATGLATRRPALLELGRRYVAVVLVAAVGAFVVMETALFGHDFSIKYVADNVARATPGLYTFTAAWGALEGSILLWALLLSVYVAVTTWRFRNRSDDPLVAWATLVQYAVLLFFFALMLFAANPFKAQTGSVPFDGAGPNPLLQNHPLVAIHPPFLY